MSAWAVWTDRDTDGPVCGGVKMNCKSVIQVHGPPFVDLITVSIVSTTKKTVTKKYRLSVAVVELPSQNGN